MELTDLHYFFHVATAQSFSQGAKAAHISPGAASKAVKKLEDELATALFVRTTRNVMMTESGRVLFERCRRIFAELDATRSEIADVGAVLAGRIRIGAMEVFSIDLLPRALVALLARAPAVVPHSHEMIPERMEALLLDGTIDVGFTVGGGASPRIRATTIGTSPAVVVIGRRHPLYAQTKVPVSDLRELPWVIPRFLGMEHLPPIDGFPDDELPRAVGATVELLQMGIRLVVEGSLIGTFPLVSVREHVATGSLRVLPDVPVGAPYELNALTHAEAPRRRIVDEVIDVVRRTLVEAG